MPETKTTIITQKGPGKDVVTENVLYVHRDCAFRS